jgi:hypothetical protein
MGYAALQWLKPSSILPTYAALEGPLFRVVRFVYKSFRGH